VEGEGLTFEWLKNIISKIKINIQNSMNGKVFYVTKEKLQELKKEYEELIVLERNKTVGQEAPKVFESEDMNPEFVSYQEDMDKLRLRIDELNTIIEKHELIKNPSKDKQGLVNVGATVLIDINGAKDKFTIVGTLEANPGAGKISNESPVGMALLGHKIGDEIHVPLPTKKIYKVKDIKYEIN